MGSEMCIRDSLSSSGRIYSNVDFEGGGTSVVGKRSKIKAVKRGMSALTNLGMLLNFIALIRIESSDKLGSALFSEPAMTRRDLTALIPKS